MIIAPSVHKTLRAIQDIIWMLYVDSRQAPPALDPREAPQCPNCPLWERYCRRPSPCLRAATSADPTRQRWRPAHQRPADWSGLRAHLCTWRRNRRSRRRRFIGHVILIEDDDTIRAMLPNILADA